MLAAGAHGVVVGCQDETGALDREALARIVDAAGGASVTLHRVIDVTPDPIAALRTARELGIQGVPFFVADRRLGLSGAQPVEVFAQLLDQAWRDAKASARTAAIGWIVRATLALLLLGLAVRLGAGGLLR